MTLAPSAGSNTFHLHWMFSWLNLEIILLAISSKLPTRLDISMHCKHSPRPFHTQLVVADNRGCAGCGLTCGKRQDGGASARKADSEKTGLGGGGHGRNDVAEARDERLAVLLVQLVLHGEVDHVRVGRGLAERDRQEGDALEVERHVLARVVRRQDLARLGRRHLERGHDGDGLDLLGPGELDVVADAEGRHGRALAGVLTTCRRGQDFAQGDFDTCDILRRQRLEVCADEASK